MSATPLDTSTHELFPGVVLLKMSSEKMAERRNAQREAAEGQLRNAGQSYAAGQTSAELEAARSEGFSSLRLQRGDHGMEYEDAGGRIVRQYKPNLGIAEGSPEK